MIRTRLFKKTCHYLWRDVLEATKEIIVPGLAWIAVIFVGLVLTVIATVTTAQLFGVTDTDSPLLIIPFIGAGYLYYIVCSWIHGAYVRAQKKIYNENKETLDTLEGKR